MIVNRDFYSAADLVLGRIRGADATRLASFSHSPHSVSRGVVTLCRILLDWNPELLEVLDD